ncbi:MAG: adenylate/guanylate cyclase domain-containing protein [Treponema sp.]|nr:adenylate/guanylate cyclase domain-containing protein [Treponema sp.]
MQKKSGPVPKKSRAGFIVPVCLFMCGVLLSFTGIWSAADRSVYDILLRIKCRVDPVELTPRIVSVDLTDSAERSLGDAVDNRTAFADALEVMKKAGISGCFDFLFAGSRDPAGDRRLAQTASAVPGFVVVTVPLSQKETGISNTALTAEENAVLEKNLWHPVIVHAGAVPSAAAFLLPYPDLAARVPHLAHAGLLPDSDGVERRVPLLYRWNDGYMPSVPLVLAAQALDADIKHSILDAGREFIMPLKNGKNIHIPVDINGCMYIPYAGLWKNGLRRIPLDTFAAAAHDDTVYEQLYDMLDGAVLCISDLTTAKKDFGITPLEPVYPLSGVHTTVLNAILTQSFFRSGPVWLRILTSLLLTCGVLFAVVRKKDVWFHGVCGIMFMLFTGETLVLWFCSGIVPSFCGLCAALAVFWLSAWLFRLAAAYRERMLMENALSRYFPRALAARVLKEGKTDLVPAKKELTMLFSDIAGFTHWSSDKAPETVHAFLTDYLTSIAEIVFAHGGTVDKFIGDGMLAFFGDPFEQPDHAERAVEAAVDMQKKIRLLAAKWKPLVGIDLKVRIGINTGDVIAGNLGTDVRIDYTVIGAAVNLASRMESNAPAGGILIAENTHKKVHDKFLFTGPELVTAKGYEQPVQAYVLDQHYD